MQMLLPQRNEQLLFAILTLPQDFLRRKTNSILFFERSANASLSLFELDTLEVTQDPLLADFVSVRVLRLFIRTDAKRVVLVHDVHEAACES